jgi:hypothetical protein
MIEDPAEKSLLAGGIERSYHLRETFFSEFLEDAATVENSRAA